MRHPHHLKRRTEIVLRAPKSAASSFSPSESGVAEGRGSTSGIAPPPDASGSSSSKPNALEIAYVPIEAVREYKSHARVHDKKAVAKAKSLLSAHGQIVPIVIDQNGEILDGDEL